MLAFGTIGSLSIYNHLLMIGHIFFTKFLSSDRANVKLFLEIYILNTNVSDIVVHSREVGTGTRATLSCVVSDITQAVSIVWKSGGSTVVDGDGITTKSGDYSSSSQTAALEIASAEADKTYTCEVKSGALPNSEPAVKSLDIFVYSKFCNMYWAIKRSNFQFCQ